MIDSSWPLFLILAPSMTTDSALRGHAVPDDARDCMVAMDDLGASTPNGARGPGTDSENSSPGTRNRGDLPVPDANLLAGILEVGDVSVVVLNGRLCKSAGTDKSGSCPRPARRLFRDTPGHEKP